MSTAPFASFSYVLQRFMFPCNIATVGYFLLPECTNGFDSGWSYQSLVSLGIFCLVMFWIFIDTMGLFVLYTAGISQVQGILIFKYTKYFQNCVEVNLETKSHTTYKVFSVYRQLQLLTRYFNGIQQQGIIFTILISDIICIVFGAYILISMGPKLPLPDFTLFFFAWFDGMVVLVVYFTVMSKVNSEAQDALQYIGKFLTPRISNGNTKKWARVFLMSLKSLQVNIGSVNFVDKFTPVTLLDFCVGQIVSLLLMD